MDWAKAKTILIIALVVLNVFLCVTFGVFGRSNTPDAAESDLTAETATLLESRAIDLKIDLPEAAGKRSIVTVDRIELSERKINNLIVAEKALAQEDRTEENIRAKAQEVLEQLGVWEQRLLRRRNLSIVQLVRAMSFDVRQLPRYGQLVGSRRRGDQLHLQLVRDARRNVR